MGILALIPIKDWLYGGCIVLLIVFGIHVHNKLLAEGIAEQKAADDSATVALVAQTAKQTAELQARATMAEQAYDKELQTIANQSPVQPVRLCLNSHNSSPVVPKAGAVNPGNATAGASAAGVQPLPSGNSGMGAGAGPDIGNLLDLLAQRADATSAELREFQNR